MQPGTVVNVVNSYAATSEYTPAKLLNRVDLPTDGNPEINRIIMKNLIHIKYKMNSNNIYKFKNKCKKN